MFGQLFPQDLIGDYVGWLINIVRPFSWLILPILLILHCLFVAWPELLPILSICCTIYHTLLLVLLLFCLYILPLVLHYDHNCTIPLHIGFLFVIQLRIVLSSWWILFHSVWWLTRRLPLNELLLVVGDYGATFLVLAALAQSFILYSFRLLVLSCFECLVAGNVDVLLLFLHSFPVGVLILMHMLIPASWWKIRLRLLVTMFSSLESLLFDVNNRTVSLLIKFDERCWQY